MKRRSFLKSSVLAASFSGVIPAVSQATLKSETRKKHRQQFYELRTYTLKDQAQQTLVEQYFQQAAIPALNRIGSKTVGVFTELKPEGQTKLYALIPFDSIDDFV